ncbi:MAG: hypothetical protein NVS4B7_05780 [Ktedonobacteraceae bacterium]
MHMADEQIIYLSPEEELTNVRERLERIPSRRIILVIPTQTQLRSHVSWRLLHARARELNKDVLIISSDRQIRSVVKAAGFKVADSLESPPSSKPRIGSRSGRSSLGGKTSARLRTPPGKTLASRQAGSLRNYQADQSDISAAMKPQVENKNSRGAEVTLNRVMPPASSTFEIEDVTYGPEFDYRISSPAPVDRYVSPVLPRYEDEEPDLLAEDFHRAQRIREAAQRNNKDTMRPPTHQSASSESMPHIQDLPSTARKPTDSFSYIADEPTVELPGQPTFVSMNEVDDGISDISERPTDVINIEDQGDMGDFVAHADASSLPWMDQDAEEEQDMPGPSRVHGVRPRASRTGKVLPPSPPPDLDQDTELPPVYEQPTRTSFTHYQTGGLAPASAAPMGSINNRRPQAVSLPHPRPQSKSTPLKPVPPPKRKPNQRANAGIAGTGRSSKRATATQPRDRTMLGRLIMFLLILLVIIPIVLLVIVPSADVTVTLPSHNYTLQMKLTATNTSRLDVLHHTLPAQTLGFDTSATGGGQADGRTTVGNKSATGFVSFTNSGSGQVIVPTGTIIATKDGVQFVTQAEVPADGRPTPVLAATAGVAGNVASNTITAIPQDSLAKIQQYNPGVPVNLNVTNTSATTGGGAGSATTVTTDDVNKVKTSLDIQLQKQVKNYLGKNTFPGDQAGKPILTETPVSTPAIGNITSDGTFTETLKLHMTVLVVRAADLQAAASAQLKDALSRQHSSEALVPQQQVILQQLKNTSPGDGNSIVLNFTALGQIAPQISEDAIRNQVLGKSIDNAKQALTGSGGIPGVTNPQIAVSPDLFHWMPFLPQRINVHFKTQPVKSTSPPKPKK